MNDYSENMVKKRKELGYSQAEFASYLHYSTQTIAKYESGASEMDISSLIYASRFLHLDVDSFLEGKDEKNNDLAETHDFDPDLFASNLVRARLAKRMNQKALASLSSISSRSLKNYEAGKSIPSLSVFAAFCRVLDVKASTFLFEDLSNVKGFEATKKSHLKLVGILAGAFLLFLLPGTLFAGFAISNALNKAEPVVLNQQRIPAANFEFTLDSVSLEEETLPESDALME